MKWSNQKVVVQDFIDHVTSVTHRPTLMASKKKTGWEVLWPNLILQKVISEVPFYL